MRQEKCILCGEAYPTGLQIMGCLICFRCEKRLLSLDTPDNFRRLGLIYEVAPEMRIARTALRQTV